MPTSTVVVLDSIAAARPALSGAVVLHARNADRSELVDLSQSGSAVCRLGAHTESRVGRLCWPGAAPIKPPRVAYRRRGGSTNLPAIYSCFIARFGGVSDGKGTHG